MSFVGTKGDKKDESLKTITDDLGDKKESKKKLEKGETPRQLKERDLNKTDQSKVKGSSDDKLNKELEKSKNVISDLKDQLVYSNKERDF